MMGGVMNYDDSRKNLETIVAISKKYSTQSDFDFDPTQELVNTVMEYENILEWLEAIKTFMPEEEKLIVDMIINDLNK
jgi:cell fate (sporulation/competence/biofilm development) regulator YlbF (YheA/YmcA/DUF963 family)